MTISASGRHCAALALLLALLASTSATTAEQPARGARTIVTKGPEVALAIVWPAPETLERGLPAGTSAIAAGLLVNGLLEGRESSESLVMGLSDGLAVGVRIGEVDANDMIALAKALAEPQLLDGRALVGALEREDARSRERTTDPVFRAIAGSLHFGLGPGAGLAVEPGLSLRSRVDAESLAIVFERVRQAPLELAFVGPSALAVELEAALSHRLAPRAGGSDLGDFRRGVFVTSENGSPLDAEGEDARVVVAHAFRVSAARAAALGPSLPLLVESLRSGEGSLDQRLAVAVADDAGSSSEVRWFGDRDGGGLLVVLVDTSRSRAAETWTVMEGVAASLAALPLRPDSLSRARARLDARTKARRESVEQGLMELLGNEAGIWPPEGRWSKPPGPDDVRAAAAAVFDVDARLAVIAGDAPWEAIPDSLEGEATGFRFGVNGLELCAPLAADSLPVDRATIALARRVLAVLGVRGDAPRSYAARYRITEPTPLGDGILEAALERAEDGSVLYDIARGDLGMQIERGPGGGATIMPDGEVTASSGAGGRVASLAHIEPAVLAADVVAGAVVASSGRVPCEAAAAGCEALVIEPSGGGRLVLVMREDGLPVEARVWWFVDGRERIHDERVRLVTWSTLSSGLRVSRERDLEDVLGATRRVALIEWKAPGHATVPDAAEGQR